MTARRSATNRANAAPVPASFSPQLATLASAVPTGPGWGFEIKFDGYRILARVEEGQARLFTRAGNDWTGKMPSLAAAVAQLPVGCAWLDCEAVVLDAQGRPDFNALQNAFDRAGSERIELFVFDAPYFQGDDLRALDLATRRSRLHACFTDAPGRLHFSESFDADGQSVLESACKMGLEGIMAKRLDSPYESRRTSTWLKVKCQQRQEFVVGGFTARAGTSTEVGSLLLGVYDDGHLIYAGSVGTGWNSRTSAAILAKLLPIEVATSPFDPAHQPGRGRWSRRPAGSERWVKPTLVVEVQFAEWTPDGSVRHATFRGLRTDKAARSVQRERPVSEKSPG